MKISSSIFGLWSLITIDCIFAQNIFGQDSLNNIQALQIENQKSADFYFERANTLTKSKMFSLDSSTACKAADDYLMAIKLKPKFWQARRNYARQMIFLKKYDSAIEQLNYALKIVKSDENPDLNVMRGQAYYEKGLYEKAILDFDEAINFSGNIDYLLLFKAKAQWKLGQFANACENFKRSLEMTPHIINDKEFLSCD